jgi:hypothetical protein
LPVETTLNERFRIRQEYFYCPRGGKRKTSEKAKKLADPKSDLLSSDIN